MLSGSVPTIHKPHVQRLSWTSTSQFRDNDIWTKERVIITLEKILKFLVFVGPCGNSKNFVRQSFISVWNLWQHHQVIMLFHGIFYGSSHLRVVVLPTDKEQCFSFAGQKAQPRLTNSCPPLCTCKRTTLQVRPNCKWTNTFINAWSCRPKKFEHFQI